MTMYVVDAAKWMRGHLTVWAIAAVLSVLTIPATIIVLSASARSSRLDMCQEIEQIKSKIRETIQQGDRRTQRSPAIRRLLTPAERAEAHRNAVRDLHRFAARDCRGA